MMKKWKTPGTLFLLLFMVLLECRSFKSPRQLPRFSTALYNSLFIKIRLPARKDIILFLLVSFLFYTKNSDEILRELQCEINGLSHGTVTLKAGFAVSECRLVAGYA